MNIAPSRWGRVGLTSPIRRCNVPSTSEVFCMWSKKELMGRPRPMVKSFEINERLGYMAWEGPSHDGVPGVDTVSITEFADHEQV